LKVDIEKDEGFFKDGMATFIMKVSTMTGYKIKQEELPSQYHIKQLKSCWIQRINVLMELSIELDDLTYKKTKDYSKLIGLDLAGNTIEVQDLKLISDSMLQTRQ
jgi:GTPase SAR1 family protein